MFSALGRPKGLIVTAAAMLALTTLPLARPVQAATAQDAIQSFKFNPTPLTIEVGTSVTWTNQDTAPHTATSDAGSAFQFDTGMLQKGQSGSVTFTQVGTFAFHCSVHPNMHGTVIVQAAGTPLSAHPLITRTILATGSSGKYVFSPKKTTIAVGTKVWWSDKSSAPHTVTSDTRSWKFDKKFTVGHRVSFVFSKAGTYKYHCAYHPGMVATIVVK